MRTETQGTKRHLLARAPSSAALPSCPFERAGRRPPHDTPQPRDPSDRQHDGANQQKPPLVSRIHSDPLARPQSAPGEGGGAPGRGQSIRRRSPSAAGPGAPKGLGHTGITSAASQDQRGGSGARVHGRTREEAGLLHHVLANRSKCRGGRGACARKTGGVGAAPAVGLTARSSGREPSGAGGLATRPEFGPRVGKQERRAARQPR